MLSILYSILFASSIVLINPWGNNPDVLGTSKGEIWTQPKVLMVLLIAIANICLILRNLQRQKTFPTLPTKWKIASVLWFLYLGSGLLATIFSPFPKHSLWGNAVMGDGWLYWLLIATFTITNTLVINFKPNLLQAQLRGVLVGGCILAFSVFPQILNWRIDYTATSGQTTDFNSNLLVSFIWQQEMPIGLYSNRGYAAFVLAGIVSLCIALSFKGWMKPRLTSTICLALCTALFFTQSRGGILALVVAIAYLIVRYHSVKEIQTPRNLTGFFLLSFLALISYGFYRFFPDLNDVGRLSISEVLEKIFTGRIYLWQVAIRGIFERPWFGWGYNGFDIAHLFVGDWAGRLSSYVPDQPIVSQITKLNEFTFEYISFDGGTYIGDTINPKADNLILDITLSVGVLGFFSYASLLGFYLWRLVKSHFWGFEAFVIVYLTFTLTWFEAAQFTHLPWWILSIGLTSASKSALTETPLH